MLPFLDKKKVGSIVMAKMKGGAMLPDEKEGSENMEGLHAAAEDVLAAIGAGDAKALAMALRAAFEICDEMPHEEGPHIEEV